MPLDSTAENVPFTHPENQRTIVPTMAKENVTGPHLRSWLRGTSAATLVLPSSTLIAWHFLDLEPQRQNLLAVGMPPAYVDEIGYGVSLGDLVSFAVWTFGLSAILMLLAVALGRVTLSLPAPSQTVVFIAAGSGAGFVWTLVATQVLQTWFGSFDFPVLYCWVGGASIAVVATELLLPIDAIIHFPPSNRWRTRSSHIP